MVTWNKSSVVLSWTCVPFTSHLTLKRTLFQHGGEPLAFPRVAPVAIRCAIRKCLSVYFQLVTTLSNFHCGSRDSLLDVLEVLLSDPIILSISFFLLIIHQRHYYNLSFLFHCVLLGGLCWSLGSVILNESYNQPTVYPSIVTRFLALLG